MTGCSVMFEGRLAESGRFSYESLLMRDCPDEFRDAYNPWNIYAWKIMMNHDFTSDDWQWKTPHQTVREKQLRSFSDFCKSVDLLFRQYPSIDALARRAAVIAWMLSNMIERPPASVISRGR